MNRSELVATLEFVGAALPRDTVLVPIFGCYCFTPGKVYAFNDQLAIQAKCQIQEPFADSTFAVHGKTLRELLKCSSSKEAWLELKEGNLLVVCGESEVALPYFSKEDFLFELPKPQKGDPTFHCDENMLLGIETCLSTVSRDQTQAAFMGVTLLGNNLYSCDGDAVTKYRFSNRIYAPEPKPALLPTAFCEALIKVPRNRAAKLTITDGWVIADCGDPVLFGRLLENPNPPDFEGMITSTLKGEPKYVATNSALTEALSRAWVLAEPFSAGTLFTVKKNVLTLDTKTALGEVSDTIEFEHPNVKAKVVANMASRALRICDEMAIMDNCTVYRQGQTVLQVVSNLGE